MAELAYDLGGGTLFVSREIVGSANRELALRFNNYISEVLKSINKIKGWVVTRNTSNVNSDKKETIAYIDLNIRELEKCKRDGNLTGRGREYIDAEEGRWILLREMIKDLGKNPNEIESAKRMIIDFLDNCKSALSKFKVISGSVI